MTILWDGITRTKVNSINGDFSGTFVVPSNTIAGNHTLTALINDQNFLRGSSDDTEILVMRETEVTLQWLGGFRNSTSVVSGYLRDVVGVGLPEHKLDVYFDDEIGDSRQSIAFSLSFQSSSKTLTDKEVDLLIEKIIHKLKSEFGIKQR